MAASGEHSRRRDLGGWEDRLKVGRELAGGAKALRPAVRPGTATLAGPRDGQFAGQRHSTSSIDIGGEFGQPPAFTFEFESQGTTQT